MKRFFLFIGNLAACIVENASTRGEEQPLCKTYSRRSELFRKNHFWRFDKVSDKIKPHNKITRNSAAIAQSLTFFYGKPFLLQFLQSHGTSSIREQINFTDQVIQGGSVRFIFYFDELSRTVKYQGAFSRMVGFAGKRFHFSPPPPPSTFLFFAPALTFAQ